MITAEKPLGFIPTYQDIDRATTELAKEYPINKYRTVGPIRIAWRWRKFKFVLLVDFEKVTWDERLLQGELKRRGR
jgi:hypothetical protein